MGLGKEWAWVGSGLRNNKLLYTFSAVVVVVVRGLSVLAWYMNGV